MVKERLDIMLVRKGYFPSREKARSAIMAGAVSVNGERADKPGAMYKEDISIDVREKVNPFVSRGGLKLEKALKTFNIDLKDKTALDVGASTGGFTDCMLKNGASKVLAIDVGYGQLAWELRNDGRVVCMERTNIRNVKPEDIGVLTDFAAIDVSFISLKKVLPVVKDLIRDGGNVVCLVKPQFEAGRQKVGKRGVVRDPETHKEVLREMTAFAVEAGFCVKNMTYSPVKGPEGNIEYLLHLSKLENAPEDKNLHEKIAEVVNESHESLN